MDWNTTSEHPEFLSGVVNSARAITRNMVVGDESVSSDMKRGEQDVPYDQIQLGGAMYGYNVSSDKTKFFPRLSHAHIDAMLEGTDKVHYTELCAILSTLFRPGSDQWYEYLSIRVAQRKQMEDGTGEYSVVRNVFPPYIPRALRVRQENMKEKKYELIQFFSDISVVEKYNLSRKFISTIQALAINDPVSAAATLQEKVQSQSQGVIIRVTAGRYSESKDQCQRILKKSAAGIQDPQGASHALLAGDQLFVYEPGKDESDGWYVYGPLAYSRSVYDVYKMVIKSGLREVAVLFAFELVKLNICIHTGEEFVATTFIANVGDTSLLDFKPLKYSMVFGDVTREFEKKIGNCLPVISDGKSVATALRISEFMVVVNSHVIESSECYIEGKKLIGGIPLGQDLWGFDIQGHCSPWKIRQPIIGERAVLVAYTSGSVAVSSDFRVDKLDGLNVFSKRIAEVVEGASGAALMSLDDGALLGIHSGLSGIYMLAVALNPTLLTDIRDWEADRARGNVQRDELSVSVVQELEKRGARAPFTSAVDNLVPVFDLSGVHVGTALNIDCKLLTTLPAGKYLLGIDKVISEFQQFAGLYNVCYDSKYITALNPTITRYPDPFETVVIVGTDVSSPYVSRTTTIKQVAHGKRTFMLSSTEGNMFPLTGGIIISMQDAAVLGSFVRDSTSTDVGRLSLCTSVVRDQPQAVRDDISMLLEKFPRLNVRAWPANVATEVLTHSSLQGEVNNLNLARVGDSAIRAVLHSELRKNGYQGNQQDLVVKYQSNSALSDLAWKVGLAPLLRKQVGISFQASAKVYADMVEALLGAAFIYETSDVFLDLCFSLGVIPVTADLSPRLLRRGSSFVGLSVPFGKIGMSDDLLITPVD